MPPVTSGSEDCNIDTAHALFASVNVHGHCLAPQRPRNVDFLVLSQVPLACSVVQV